MLHICACASPECTARAHGPVHSKGPASSRLRAEEWLLPSFGANESASERLTPAGCSVRGEAADALGARAWCHCRTCDAREVRARMLGMCSAYPDIPCLPVLPQVSKMKPSALDGASLHVEGGQACVLHEHCAWGACGRRGAARKARGASRLPRPPYGCGGTRARSGRAGGLSGHPRGLLAQPFDTYAQLL